MKSSFIARMSHAFILLMFLSYDALDFLRGSCIFLCTQNLLLLLLSYEYLHNILSLSFYLKCLLKVIYGRNIIFVIIYLR